MTRLGSIATAPLTPGIAYGGKREPERFTGRKEWRLAKPLGLTQFGVNYMTLAPGAWSSLRHWHEAEDEFVYVLAGTLTLVDNDGPHDLGPGDFAAFPAGEANGHQIQNRSAGPGSFIVVGSRRPGEETIHYPDQDFGPVRK
jgi:uncharacterized cupin superfamily protein